MLQHCCQTLVLLVAVFVVVEASKCCSTEAEPPRPRFAQMTFLGTDTTNDGVDDGGFHVAAHAYLQSYPAGTAGVTTGNGFQSNSPLTPQQYQRAFAKVAWTASRSGRLRDLYVNILYITRGNSTAIPGAVGNVTVTLYTAAPTELTYTPTGVSVTTLIHISPQGTSESTQGNVDDALSDRGDRSSIVAGTRVAALISYGWTSTTAISQHVAGYFFISGGYLFGG